MPEYSIMCNDCKVEFSEVWSMSEYPDKIKKAKCPECNSQALVRDFQTDKPRINYVKGLHECKTLGEYADKQTKAYGKEKVESMKRDFVTKKREDTGMKELPTGMSRANENKTPLNLTKKQAKKKRGGKKK